MVGRCSDYLHLVLFEGATEKQHDVTDIQMGPGSPRIIARCNAVDHLEKWGPLHPDGSSKIPRGLDDHVRAEQHGQTGYQTEGLEETDLSCIIVCYLSYFPTLFPAGHIMIVNTFYKDIL